MGFRSVYTLDGQGHDFSSSYAKKYQKSLAVPIPEKRPEFKRCTYSMDGQGHDLSYPKSYSSASSTPRISRTNSEFVLGDDVEWRAVYDLGQRPTEIHLHHHHYEHKEKDSNPHEWTKA